MSIVQRIRDAYTRHWAMGSGQTAESVVTQFKSRVIADGGVVEAEQYLKDSIQELMDKGVWDKLSAAWIPSGYAEGKLYAVKGGPEADLGFTRAGLRTRIGPSGYIEDVPYNLLPNSNIFQGIPSSNTATPDVGVTPIGLPSTSCRIGPVNDGVRLINSTILVTEGEDYTLSFYIRHLSGDNVLRIRLDSNLGANMYNESVEIGSEWTHIVRTITIPAGVTLLTTNSRLRGGDGDLQGVFEFGAFQLVHGVEPKNYFNTTNRQHVPAIEFYNGSPSLNLEKASTNLLRSSNDFGNSTYWTNANSIGITPFSISSPTGTLSGVKLTESDNTANHQIVQGIGKDGSALQYTLSVYAKKAERNWIRLQVSESANGVRVWFNLDTGEIGTTLTYGSDFTLDNVKISPYKDGWYRCEVTCTSNASTSLNSVIAIQEQDNFTSYTGDGSSGIYVYQAQLEQGAYATSNIPTDASTASRIQDAFKKEGITIPESGSFYFHGSTIADGTNKCIGFSNGSNSERLAFTFSSNNQIHCWTTAGGIQRNIPSAVEFSTGEELKCLITWEGSVVKLYANGTLLGENTLFTLPNISQFHSAVNGSNILPFFGSIQGLSILSYLSDDEAIALTTL